jgi:teichuronic acid biosynthesis glycosyltransferase TuaC
MTRNGSSSGSTSASRARRLRGLVLTNLFATPAEPGRATFNQQQFRELAKLHDLLIAVPRAKRRPCAPNVERLARSDAAALDVVYFDVWHPALLGRFINAKLVERAACAALDADFRTWRPDYVLGSFAYPEGVAAVNVARRLGVPAFIKVHGTDVNQMLDSWGVGPQIRGALQSARGVIAVSQALTERVHRVRSNAADTLLLYNGVDRELFLPRDRSAARVELGLPEARRSILYIGNLKRDKGVLDAVEAFGRIAPQHPDVDLEIIGAGPDAADVRSLIDGLGLGERARMRGAQPHRSLSTWFAAGHLLCLPSYAEGVPNVVLEALASGRPVVATRVGGIPEVVGEASGELVRPRDPVTLADALTRVLAADWDAARLSAAVPAAAWSDNGKRLAQFLALRAGDSSSAAEPARSAPEPRLQ